MLPVAAIQALRLTCRHCGAAVVIPLTARNGPAQCFNCCSPLPSAELMHLVAGLRWLKDVTTGKDATLQAGFEAALEHDGMA